jgi:sugar diacid utilization regulator
MEVSMLTHLSHDQIGDKSMDVQTLTLADAQSNNTPPLSRANVRLFDALHHLVTTLTLPGSLDEMLNALVTLVMQSIAINLCVIQLKDKASDQLKIHTCVPDSDEQHIFCQPVTIDAVLWDRFCVCMRRGQLPRLDAQELEALNPLKNVRYKTLLPVPLIAGGEVLGLINCYANSALFCNPDEQLVLLTIANQAALAIKHRLYVAEDADLHQTRVRALLDDLFTGEMAAEDALIRRAHALGCDLAGPHAVTVVEAALENVPSRSDQPGSLAPEEYQIAYEGMAQQLRYSIQTYCPGSLIAERDHQLVCLLSLHNVTTIEQVKASLSKTMQRIERELRIEITAGLGNVGNTMSEYRRSFAEAHEALELGHYLRKTGCIHFNDLGVLRYIHKFAQIDTLCDRYQEQVALIVEYDQRKKANLLDTLEMYLECGGNMARTSSLLDVHRNTLLQRIDRLHKLCELDLEAVSNRLPLLLAIKVHKMRTRCTIEPC